jgi:hypothetical protein
MSFSWKIVSLSICAALWSGSAFAGSVVVQLTRASLINVSDAAGVTQHEAGKVSKGTAVVGDYFLSRRVDTFAGSKFNTGATHITLLFAPRSGAPENVTLDGAHDFSSGNFKGSVSAASNRYSWIENADASYNVSGGVETLVIIWTGSNQLTLP